MAGSQVVPSGPTVDAHRVGRGPCVGGCGPPGHSNGAVVGRPAARHRSAARVPFHGKRRVLMLGRSAWGVSRVRPPLASARVRGESFCCWPGRDVPDGLAASGACGGWASHLTSLRLPTPGSSPSPSPSRRPSWLALVTSSEPCPSDLRASPRRRRRELSEAIVWGGGARAGARPAPACSSAVSRQSQGRRPGGPLSPRSPRPRGRGMSNVAGVDVPGGPSPTSSKCPSAAGRYIGRCVRGVASGGLRPVGATGKGDRTRWDSHRRATCASRRTRERSAAEVRGRCFMSGAGTRRGLGAPLDAGSCGGLFRSSGGRRRGSRMRRAFVSFRPACLTSGVGAGAERSIARREERTDRCFTGIHGFDIMSVGSIPSVCGRRRRFGPCRCRGRAPHGGRIPSRPAGRSSRTVCRCRGAPCRLSVPRS